MTVSTVSTNSCELLAPAGDWECLRAACANGADAVYFGLSDFNARHRAHNFTLEELPQVVEYLHRHNVRGYVTMNTLIFSDELAAASQMIAGMAASGVDAVIVQDLGLARLIHEVAPDLAIHGSTQMTLTEPQGIEYVRRLGIERVIVARELSLADVKKIRAATDLPVEVFVHGALCVAYSGQCLTSEALGGRSANRGQCAQACRLPYDLVVDGEVRDLGDVAYLLSPQDLASYDFVDELVAAGVCSLKIEGRLKSAHYVAATTKTYRAALDAALAKQEFKLERQAELDLQQSFSRGFSPGFLKGLNHQKLVSGRFPKARGVRVGTVVGTTAAGVLVDIGSEHDLSIVKAGDGCVFDEGHPDQDEQGGRLYGVRTIDAAPHGDRPRRLEIFFAEGSLNLSAIAIGAIVWRTDDPTMRRRMEQTFNREPVPRRVAIHFHAAGRVGGPLTLTARDFDGREASAEWEGPLALATKHPLTVESLREQCGRLGDTPFELGEVTLDAVEPIMVPKSVMNDLRRRAVEQLLQARLAAPRARPVRIEALDELRAAAIARKPVQLTPTDTPSLYVLARTMTQLEAVLAWQPEAPLARPAMVYCDFEDVRRYKEAVPLARAAGIPIGLATLRILKPGEEGLFQVIGRNVPDAVLVRNLAALSHFRRTLPEVSLIGDFSLNVTNELTAELLLGEGLARLVPGYDLSWEQLAALLSHSAPGRFETVVHQHMPMFHMEHCVFAHTMSEGTDATNCGRPCDRHKVALRDRVGAEFPLLADTGCRNTVFNALPQSAAEYLPRMLALGLKHFRVELLLETPEQVGPLLERYARALAGLDDGKRAWRGLQVLNQLGVTRGTLQTS
ncbi:MAG: U32 family peptidase [Planctomycetia bacterium]|nr:U32 family peptidase [Planctomycetia bacterium]